MLAAKLIVPVGLGGASVQNGVNGYNESSVGEWMKIFVSDDGNKSIAKLPKSSGPTIITTPPKQHCDVPMIALGDKMSIVLTILWKRPIFRSLCSDSKLAMLFLVDTIDTSIIYVYIIL